MGHGTNCILHFLAYDHYSLTVFWELQKDFDAMMLFLFLDTINGIFMLKYFQKPNE